MSVFHLKQEMRLTHDGDAWGNTMGWWFAVADELNTRDPALVPAHWEFRPSPLGPSNDPDAYETYVVEEAPTKALIAFGNILTRYAQRLRRAGLDY